MASDLISRSELLEAMDEVEARLEECMCIPSWAIAKQCIRDFPTVEPVKWIPCSERLPEEPEYGVDGYIVQRRKIYEPHSAYWDGKVWSDDECNILQDVIAWKPLPKPYEAGENGTQKKKNRNNISR